jgi:hypothetical protein
MEWDKWYQRGWTACRAGVSAAAFKGPSVWYGAWIRGWRACRRIEA